MKPASASTAVTRIQPPANPADLMARLMEALTSKNGIRVKLSERVFLTLKEAAEYSGLPQSWLLDLVKKGALADRYQNGVGHRIKRKDLEAL